MPTPVLNYNIGVSLDWLSPKIKLIISENQIPKDQISKRSIFPKINNFCRIVMQGHFRSPGL